MLSGSCLCAGIQIKVDGPTSDITICHCSLCRKCSGSAFLASVTVAADQLTWLSGKELVATFERPSGYGSAYCRTCGSPAPDQSYDKTTYAIPVGMLDESHELKVQEHIFVGSKASSDIIGDSAPQRHEMESSSPAGS